MNAKRTQSGFEWGPAKVDVLFGDDKKGWVVIGIKSTKEELQVYVTRTGKIRIHSPNGVEWKKEKKNDPA